MTIQSMTGFGRSSGDCDGLSYSVEIRSVNHRYLDVKVRLPKGFAGCEAAVRAAVQTAVTRGRVEVNVQGGSDATGGRYEVDLEAAADLKRAHEAVSVALGVPIELSTRTILSAPGILRVLSKDTDVDQLNSGLTPLVVAALGILKDMRGEEGSKLQLVLLEQLSLMHSLVEALRERAPSQAQAYRTRLQERIELLLKPSGAEVDSSKVLHEVASFAERTDIMEELDRLDGHVAQCRSLIVDADGQAVGRRLDFLTQEMNREANTIGSKAQDSQMLENVVELKNELERFREQVQNVE